MTADAKLLSYINFYFGSNLQWNLWLGISGIFTRNAWCCGFFNLGVSHTTCHLHLMAGQLTQQRFLTPGHQNQVASSEQAALFANLQGGGRECAEKTPRLKKLPCPTLPTKILEIPTYDHWKRNRGQDMDTRNTLNDLNAGSTWSR